MGGLDFIKREAMESFAISKQGGSGGRGSSASFVIEEIQGGNPLTP